MKAIFNMLSWQTIVGVCGTALLALALTLFARTPSQVELQREALLSTRGVPPMPPLSAFGMLGAEPAPAAPPPTGNTLSEGATSRDREILQLAAEDGVISKGAETYQMFCASCHGVANIGGDSPSNLFDTVWYRGNTPAAIERTILEGYMPTGMPAWQGMLPEEQLASVAAYLVSLNR